MGTSRETLASWFDRGQEQGATHMVVVCDTYDWEDYPVYVSPTEKVADVEAAHQGNMQMVMEVYSYKLSKESQMAERRAFHYE